MAIHYSTSKIIFCTLILLHSTFTTASVVYSFRIAQITKHSFLQENKKHSSTILTLPFNTRTKLYSGTTYNFAGDLSSLIYNYKGSFARVDFGIANINQSCNGITSFSDTESDDILLNLGKDFEITKNSQCNLSGLLGIPTHPVYLLQHISFGIGQVGTGVQLDGIYHFSHTADFIWGSRFLYFVPKNAVDLYGGCHRFTIGKMVDLLFALKNRWNHHALEGGYSARWGFDPLICPDFADLTRQGKYMLNSFYLVYQYTLIANNVAHQFLFDISYGFHRGKQSFNIKHSVTVWAAWSISF